MRSSKIQKELQVDILVAEIGSTTTVVSAFVGVNKDDPMLIGQGFATTTVAEGDVTSGLEGAILSLHEALCCKKLTADVFMASSSAAGGLKMTVHGLVHEMTVRAAQEAALGAGAVVRKVTSGVLSRDDLKKIQEIRPTIILLAGGVDYGEKEIVLLNASKLAKFVSGATVIYAGNKCIAAHVKRVFARADVTCRVVDNVYPQIDVLNVDPTRYAIQQIFEERITEAPGMDNIRNMVNGHIIPTPGAVFNAAMLLFEEIGDLMVVDVGGATTDIHSITQGDPALRLLSIDSEPLGKRTVEGDLGVAVNAPIILERLDRSVLSRDFGGNLDKILGDYPIIPQKMEEIKFVEMLTKEAVRAAISRHAGRVRIKPGLGGKPLLVTGRDLTRVRWIIGTGGPLTRLPFGTSLLEKIKEPGPGKELYPQEASILIDHDYIMAPAGVIAMSRPDVAKKLLLRSLRMQYSI